MSDEWRQVDGCPAYEVSRQGLVRRAIGGQGAVAGKVLTWHTSTKTGYPDVRLTVNGVVKALGVHRLVAQAFLGPRPPGMHPCGRGYMLDLFDDYADATADGYWDERAAEVAKRIVEAMTGEMQEHGDASSAAPAGLSEMNAVQGHEAGRATPDARTEGEASS